MNADPNDRAVIKKWEKTKQLLNSHIRLELFFIANSIYSIWSLNWNCKKFKFEYYQNYHNIGWNWGWRLFTNSPDN